MLACSRPRALLPVTSTHSVQPLPADALAHALPSPLSLRLRTQKRASATATRVRGAWHTAASAAAGAAEAAAAAAAMRQKCAPDLEHINAGLERLHRRLNIAHFVSVSLCTQNSRSFAIYRVLRLRTNPPFYNARFDPCVALVPAILST